MIDYEVIVITQFLYILISLFSSILLWRILPAASQASISIKQWKFGGAFAGFVFVMLLLFSTGPTDVAKSNLELLEQINTGPTIKLGVADDVKDYCQYAGLISNTDVFGFNPDFNIESSSSQILENALNLHVKRHQSGVHSHYLFIDKNRYQAALPFFKALQNKLGKNFDQKKLEIIFYPALSASLKNHSYYHLTYQDNKPVVVFELGCMYISVSDSKELYDELYLQFSKYWRQATDKESLEQVWADLANLQLVTEIET